MTTSFYNGVSGLISFQNGIDIWGDNIANVNTPGFKESIPEFASIFSNTLNTNSSPTSDIGLGSYLNSTAKDLSTGSIIDSDNPFDIAIGGDGWIGVKNNENIFYTRNGSFTRDANGYLVNEMGEYLLVANADNIVQNNGKFYIQRNVNTQNLLPSQNLSPIQLPESITLPALPTQNASLLTNLNNDTHITTSIPVRGTIDFSAMYNKNGDDMEIRNGENLFFGFGHTVTYNNGLLSSTYCFENDKKDGSAVNIDFSLNSKKIKLTLPDGSTKEDIANAIANALQKEGFNALSNQGKVTINTIDKFILTSNTPLLQNSAAAVMTYKETPSNKFDFSTMNDFISLLQNLSSTAYPNQLNISLQDGSVVVQNDSNELLNSFISKASNSNEMFLQNLGNLGEEIFPNSKNKSFKFLSNSQQFGGYIINSQGNKSSISFNFTKQKVTPVNQIWQGEITIPTPNGDIKITQNFTFDTNGNLIGPKEISFNNINFSFFLTAFSKANNTTNFQFSQDGIEEGYLTNYQIDENGNILGLFSNSQQIKLAQIPIFHFQNPQGLESIGDSRFMQTDNSGEAFLYTDENGNYIPTKILSNKIEKSNVNLSQAMTELIVTQKAFQASAKTVTTSDEMIQKAINLKR